MLRSNFIYFSLAFTVAGSALAQPSLEIQGNRIAIGEDRIAVLKTLSRYRLDCVGEEGKSITECNSILVQTSHEVASPIANIYFQRGKVKSLYKYWDRGFEAVNPIPVVQTLFSVVTQLTKDTGLTPTVTTLERRDPGITQNSIFITAGRRKVTIKYTEGLRGSDGSVIPTYASIFETVE
jgi:hypothetical protein